MATDPKRFVTVDDRAVRRILRNAWGCADLLVKLKHPEDAQLLRSSADWLAQAPLTEVAEKQDCTEAVDKATDEQLQDLVFNSFHGEGIALLPHDLLARIHKALVSQGTRMTTRNGLADELAKLAPGVVR